MKAIDNPELREIAETIAQKLKIIVENVWQHDGIIKPDDMPPFP
jgi:hypothetical protein